MARTRTLTNLIADVRQRADREGSTFVSDAEITEYLNQSISELYDLLVAARGQEYYASSSSISTVSGTSAYALPADFYQLLGVDVTVGSDTFAVEPYMFDERNRFRVAGTWTPPEPLFYRLRAANINFIPTPSAVYAVVLWYIPTATRLASGSDTFDGINGWEEYPVCDAAAKVLEKENVDATFLKMRLAVLRDRVQGLASHRDAGKPERVTDVYASSPRVRWC